jgi:predicted protein tyrosine phosphatase
MKNYCGQPVNGKILVLPKSAAQQFTYDKPWACISIGSEIGDWPKINKCQQINLLQIAFEDIDEETENYILFNEDHAKKIWEFTEKNWEKIDLLMIHCLGGVCRSPAVAAAIALKKYGNDDLYFKLYHPNALVYKILLESAGLKLSIHETKQSHEQDKKLF